ncbi:MAG: O-phospho-L-seryl-tRNA:Cys-tRNA synthase [Candidatus Lokiarchaeota archaeon]|nr:O-phospho-L-seryl-tRNA:Cys-tRNA synthase [Candidatus Lokiarchaeota archaeon]
MNDFKKSYLKKYKHIRRKIEENFINLHPIQAGGRIPNDPDVLETIIDYIDGYSTCDFCLTGRLNEIGTPPICDLHSDLAKFCDMDEVRLVPGCRQAQFSAIHALAEPGDTIIVDSLAHYTTYLSAERAGLKIVEIPNSGKPDYSIEYDSLNDLISEVKQNTKKPPKLIFLTHIGYNYGNLNDAKKTSKIAHDYDIPFLLNGAYSIGRMPVSGKNLGADIMTASLHKSFASPAPSGLLLANEPHAGTIFKNSKITGNWSDRSFNNKEIEILGCTLPGVITMGVMAAFPYVVERVKYWDKEVKKARFFSKELENLGGLYQMGQKPHNHDIMKFESPVLYEISKKHPRKGFFLYEELKDKKIWGVQPGITKSLKLSTYGQSLENLKYIIEVFSDLINS